MKWIIVAIAGFLLQIFFPWWSIALAGFICGLLFIQKTRYAFLNGFVGIFILWGSMALYTYIINQGFLAEKLAGLLHLPHGIFSVIVTGLIGGVIGGLSMVTGNELKKLCCKEGMII